MILSINAQNPQIRLINQAVAILENDGVIIYPTDSSYALGCSIQSKKAIQRIYQLQQLDPKKLLTFICHDTCQFQQFTKGINNTIFRRIHPRIPGPYTFIFEASKLVPKMMCSSRSTIGVRIPEAKIACELAKYLQKPVLSSSLPIESESNIQDPYLFRDKYEKLVDCIIDAGEMFCKQSAMLDFSKQPPEILRTGDANLDWLNVLEW